MHTDERISTVARCFESAPESEEFLALEAGADINLGGELFTIRFYLGRILGQNLFRCEWTEVVSHLGALVASRTSHAGAKIVEACQGGHVVLDILRLAYDERFRPDKVARTKALATLSALLRHPDASIDELARAAATTRKQVLRHSNTTYAIRLLREVGARTAPHDADE